MDLWLKIIQIVGSLLLGIGLGLQKKITKWTKIVSIAFCLFIAGASVWLIMRETEKEKIALQRQNYYDQLQERQELRGLGLPSEYIGGLGENPLLKHHYNEGQKYREEGKFMEAITAYKECLHHPKATIKNKVAANLLIGHCYHDLDSFPKAESFYKEGIKMSEEITDKREGLKARGVALCNLGLIAVGLKKYNDGLKYFNECLETTRETGHKEGELSIYINLGSTYADLKDFDSTISCYEKALQIAKELPNKEWKWMCYEGLGLAYGHKGDFKRAIEYFLKEEQILKKIGKIAELKGLYKDLAFSYYKIGDSRNAEKYRKLAGG